MVKETFWVLSGSFYKYMGLFLGRSASAEVHFKSLSANNAKSQILPLVLHWFFLMIFMNIFTCLQNAKNAQPLLLTALLFHRVARRSWCNWILLTWVFCIWVLSDVCHVSPWVGSMIFSLECAGKGIIYYICQKGHFLPWSPWWNGIPPLGRNADTMKFPV